MNTLANDIRHFITENFLFGQDEGLADDDSFLERQLIDSTGVLELVTHLESTYGIRIEDDELVPENLDSIQRIVRFVTRKRAPLASAADEGR